MIAKIFWVAIDKLCSKTVAFLNLGMLGVLISFLLYGDNPSPLRMVIIRIVIIALAIVLLAVVLVRTIEFVSFLVRAHADPILGRRCDFVWEFTGTGGDLLNQVFFHLQNMSFSEQRTILRDCDGFVVDQPFRPSYIAIDRSVCTASDVRIVGEPTLTRYKDYGGGADIYHAEWITTLDPPLQPFENIRLCRHSTDHAVEMRAFTDGGTEFIIRNRHQFTMMSMTVIAPDGYRFADYAVSVDNQAGKRHYPRFIRTRPKEFGVRILHWEVPYPGTDHRYKLRFKLVVL